MASRYLHSVSTGWVTLAATAIFVAFVIVVLPVQAASSAAVSGVSETPDTLLTYSAAELYRLADALGKVGRTHYIGARYTFDVIWPVVYFAFLVTAISWLARRGFPATSRWQMANLLPVAAVTFDFLENLSASLVMARYPAPTPGVAEMAGVFTLLKWLNVGASFAVLAIVFVAAIMRRAMDHRRQ
jgi:hypothetical protein